ncbi:hypothetical protein PVAND_012406 [Polypedilum vanderplanki]|uniref:Peptidase S1 domain-containing protein n=1 Tax=Polypedilum vanderplanki TaxID=319348 RepID=A0A9J6CMC3_POLVA|nr:hypothetical protein PVAND_012406 [Polypedilum vanderplanki]
MKQIFLLAFFIAVTAAENYETGELFVPENPKEFLEQFSKSVIEKEREPRIANGINATDGQFPYALRVRIFDTDGATFVCSGVIISPNYFLTVRHCFDPVLTFMAVAFVGSVHLNSAEMIERYSERFWFAPPIDGWNPDLAVCQTSQPFPLNNRVNVVRLPARSQANYQFNQYQIQIIGWGRNRNGDMTEVLKWAWFRIETNCWNNRRPTHMCSVPVEGWHVETRGGDSGGPWVTIENGTPTLIALTEGSTGSSTAWWFRGTRLTSFLNFIESVTDVFNSDGYHISPTHQRTPLVPRDLGEDFSLDCEDEAAGCVAGSSSRQLDPRKPKNAKGIRSSGKGYYEYYEIKRKRLASHRINYMSN